MRPAEGSIEEFHQAVNAYKLVRYLLAEGFTYEEAIAKVEASLDQ